MSRFLRTAFVRLTLRKSVQQVQREARTSEFKRSLSASNLVFLGVGCIIGAGIFVRTGNAAALHAGPAVLISFLIAGVICGLAALCYAELSSTLPVSGSSYTYSYATLGEFAAWAMGALLILEYGLSACVVAVGWSGYVVSLLNDFDLKIPVEWTGPHGGQSAQGVHYVFNLPAALVCLTLGLLLTIGVSESAKVNNVIVVIKVSVIVAFIAIVGWHVTQNFGQLAHNWQPFIPPSTGVGGEFGWSGIMRAATITFYAYIGFEAVSTAGLEAKNPTRDMPIGIIGSLVICTILYMLVAATMTLAVNYHDLNVPDPVAVAVDSLGAQWGWFAKLVKLGAIVGLSAVILVLIYGQTRILYSIARDGLLPRVFAAVHPRFRTPWINTLIVSFLMAVGAGTFDINTLGDMTSVGTLAAFAIVCMTVIWLRRSQPALPRGFRVPLYPIVPLLGTAACLGLIFSVEARVLRFFAIYLFVATLVYFAYGLRNSRLAHSQNEVDRPDLGEFPPPVKGEI